MRSLQRAKNDPGRGPVNARHWTARRKTTLLMEVLAKNRSQVSLLQGHLLNPEEEVLVLQATYLPSVTQIYNRRMYQMRRVQTRSPWQLIVGYARSKLREIVREGFE
jgi:hypothetical protein